MISYEKLAECIPGLTIRQYNKLAAEAEAEKRCLLDASVPPGECMED